MVLPTGERLHPASLHDEAEKLPLLARREYLRRCAGIPVSFEAELWNIREVEPGRYLVGVSELIGDADFYFEVNIAEYPQLAIVKQGARLWVEGTIEDLEQMRLQTVRLRFP
jgi:hypothetical protein